MTRDDLKSRANLIEEAYEFFLAYASQGLAGEAAGSAGEQVRDYLRRFDEALDGLADGFGTHLPDAPGRKEAMAALERDATAAQALVRLVRSRPTVSSQLVDNLNASVHVRALLTDLFLLGDLVD